MSLENLPSAETPKQPEPAKSNTKLFIILLAIALIGSWIYIIWNNSNNSNTIAQKDQQISTVSSQKDSLNTQLAALDNQYDELKTADVAKDSTISAQDKEIEAKKAAIRSILSKENITSKDLADAKKLIASLNDDITSYKAQIETLKAENTTLTVEKQVVTVQRDSVQKNLDSTKTIVKQKEDIINLGSTLHVSGFSITGINDKGNGKEKVTSSAKKINKLRIDFNIDENLITPTGNQTLYICITGPDQKPITVEALGSGTFTTRDGESKFFTEKVDINYVQGKKMPVNIYWKQNSPFTEGDYKIEVYNNGLKVGEGVQHLKKGGLFG